MNNPVENGVDRFYLANRPWRSLELAKKASLTAHRRDNLPLILITAYDLLADALVKALW